MDTPQNSADLYSLATLPPVRGLFSNDQVNAHLDDARRVLRNVVILGLTLHELHEGLRRDHVQARTQASKDLSDVRQQLGAQLEACIGAINGMGDALQDVLSRLRFYEENVTFLKIANKSYNAKVRDDAERQAIARKAQAVRQNAAEDAPTPEEVIATGPQLVPDDAIPVEAGLQNDVQPEHNHD